MLLTPLPPIQKCHWLHRVFVSVFPLLVFVKNARAHLSFAYARLRDRSISRHGFHRGARAPLPLERRRRHRHRRQHLPPLYSSAPPRTADDPK